MTQRAPVPVPLVEIVRTGFEPDSEFVEGHHYGSAVALAADGTVEETVAALGAYGSPVLPRSCNKPVQALAMVREGLDLPPDLLALVCASHSGEQLHRDGVARILDGAGLGLDALQTPPDWPLDETAKHEWIAGGGDREPVLMNCSGKHAGMLATCVTRGWDPATYLDPAHPLQRSIAATFAELTGEPVAHTAVDGCGAPLLATSLVGLARAFQRLASAQDGPERRVAEAIRAHPEYVSGTRRDERELLTALPGAIGKAGAEGVYAVALPDGRAFALKIDDGAARARPVVMAELLRRAGALDGVPAEVAIPGLGEARLSQDSFLRAALPQL